MKVALYARVSTQDQQTIPAQLEAMREYAKRQGWSVVLEVEEKESGAKDTRPKRLELIRQAGKGKFQAVIVWRLDRWSRSLADMLQTIETLGRQGVSFVSLHEQIDLTTPSGRLLFQMLGAIAEFQRGIIRENVKAGVQDYRKRNNGKWGRPATARMKRLKVMRLREEGKSQNQIAMELGISKSSVVRILQDEKANNY